MDVKLLFVPILFLLLRVWNFILDCFILSEEEKFKESTAAASLILMVVRQQHSNTQKGLCHLYSIYTCSYILPTHKELVTQHRGL